MPKTSDLTTVIPTIDDFAAFLDNADIKLKKMSLLSMSTLFNAYHYAPDGFMINGKIVPSVTTSNLTVAIKTYAGLDPSVADPVYIMISGVLRTLTTALSVTKAAGTNWCNAGSTELATQEIDYFTYIGWDTTLSSLVLGFSRIPNGRLYSDFSNTATNEKFIALGTSSPVAGDNYTNIGRFAATLGVSTTYLWTIPAYTSLNLIQRPIYETRLLQCFTVFTGFSANPTYVNFYQIIGSHVYFMVDQTVNGTSNATGFSMTMPFANARSKLVNVIAIDNGVQLAGYASLAASNIINMYPSVALGNWTASGGKRTYGWSCDYTI